MFAILITEENVSKIWEHQRNLTDKDRFAPDIYLDHKTPWYYIRGFTDSRGMFWNWTALPAFLVTLRFDIDTDKASTDWDLIVRKHP